MVQHLAGQRKHRVVARAGQLPTGVIQAQQAALMRAYCRDRGWVPAVVGHHTDHVVSATREVLEVFVAYDQRLLASAHTLGLPVAAPGLHS